MRIEELFQYKLEQICRKIFPGCAIEIKSFGAVGMWPYILDSQGQEIDDVEIARRLLQYAEAGRFEDTEELRSLSATRDCLETFVEGGSDQIRKAYDNYEAARREGGTNGGKRR